AAGYVGSVHAAGESVRGVISGRNRRRGRIAERGFICHETYVSTGCSGAQESRRIELNVSICPCTTDAPGDSPPLGVVHVDWANLIIKVRRRSVDVDRERTRSAVDGIEGDFVNDLQKLIAQHGDGS